MKILIIGFPRSGTSLTHRIFKRHSDVVYMYYERLLLWKHREKKVENLFRGFKKGQNGGEKIIYEKPHIGKSNVEYVKYCDWWNKRFKKEARIIQVMRHPYDAWNSVIKKKYIARRITNQIPKMLNNYFKCVPQNFETISNYSNSFTFKMEHLIEDPEYMLNALYEFAGLDPKRSTFKEVLKSGKSFNYKRKGFVIDNDERVSKQRKEFWKIMNKNVPKLIDQMNQFDGPKYEV